MKADIERLLLKFLPVDENGQAIRQLDEKFGFPDAFLITLTDVDRRKIINILQQALERSP